MIKKITIKGLFGNKNNEVVIEFDKTLTIITGDNGCGKTTILNIINSIISKSYQNLFTYDFKEVTIELLNENLNLIKSEDNLLLTVMGGNVETTIVFNEELTKEYSEEMIKEYEQIEIRSNRNRLEEYSSLYFPTYRRSEVELTDILSENRIPKSLFMRRINRLNKFKNTVVGINNNDISEIISRKWSYIKEAESKILNSFISEMFLKLLEIKGNSIDTLDRINENDIHNKLKEIFETTLSINETILDEKLDSYVGQIRKAKESDKKLNKILGGVLSDKEFSERLDSTMELIDLKRNVDYSLMQMLKIIDLYNEKTRRIEELKSPFKKLENTLNEFMNPKKCTIDKGRITFKHNNTTLQFDDLSAGEKQLVSIFIYIGLNLEKNGIVLIDEPEISLHVKWQRNILGRLIKNRDDIQFIISTHSPAILSDFRNNITRVGANHYE